MTQDIILTIYLFDSPLVATFITLSALILGVKLLAWAWNQIPFIG